MSQTHDISRWAHQHQYGTGNAAADQAMGPFLNPVEMGMPHAACVVRQVCAEGRNDWVDVPQAGQKLSDLKSPAAALEILPSGGAAAHHH